VRRAAVAALVAAASVLPAATADAAPAAVSIQFSQFGPSHVDVLPGETVRWTNVSERRHTVTADDASFDSGDLFAGDEFSSVFDAAGVYTYHCRVHAGMTGEVDVRRVTLGPLPTAPVPAGQAVEFEGRSADPGLPVRVERMLATGATTVARATPAPDGTWSVKAAPDASGDYRAVSAGGESGTRRLLVADRKVIIRATRAGIAVRVTPALPYGRIVLQQDLRERFGWWPVRRRRLDYVSRARFRIARPARVRVAVLDTDGWTPRAISRVLALGHAGRGTHADIAASGVRLSGR
jgi:plastocyanin